MNREPHLQERLRSLPNPITPADGWPALAQALRARKQQRLRVTLALAASIVVSFSALLTLPKPDSIVGVASRSGATETTQQNVAALMARSRALETHLAQMRDTAPVWDERSAAHAAALEGELSLVDLQLPYAEPRGAQQLWRDRVDLLDKLVRTHESAVLINASYTPRIEDHL